MARSQLRVASFEAFHRDATPIFGCPACPGHLYPKLSPKQRTYWSHIAAGDCPLAEGRALSKHQLDALLYEGRQEGPAHEALVAAIASMAQSDPSVKSDSVLVGRYLATGMPGWHGRYPDVRFRSDAGQLALEVQLSPISLHRLAERSIFYRDNDHTLVWVTRAFDPDAYKQTWLWDVWAAQETMVYSIDDQVLEQSLAQKRFLLRRHCVTAVETALVGLEELITLRWHKKVKRLWRERADKSWGSAIDLARQLLADEAIEVNDTEAWATCHAINTLIAIEDWEPAGSRHANPRAQVNDFLNSEDGRLAHRVIRGALKFYRPDALAAGRTAALLERAAQRAIDEGISSWTPNSPVTLLFRKLFPAWLDKTRT
ncbi:MAG: hypothetical protein ABS35_45815 [Kaistia sp. SCN 65-12]|nr:MAG: hypothetical protein ABS35_45815 [Kaistia sp. SCN 65-12]